VSDPRRLPVLLIDDDPAIRDALCEFLQDEGFTVATAANGREAMHWLTECRPASCVVLLDLMMPNVSGSEFLEQKQLDPLVSSYPVVVISASARTAQFGRTPDVRACISKPFEMPELFAALESCAGH
jgi:CheY-like chemotaxis protein